MGSPFVGEIRLVGFNFAPQGWAFCNGAILPISQNDVLFSLIGTTYGGDGQSTFALPDLKGRVPIHQGAGFVVGERSGVENITLLNSQMPVHNHLVMAAAGVGNQASPAGGTFAASVARQYSGPPAALTTTMAPASVASSGGNQPHDNMLPFLAVNYIISLFGIYPSRS
jgi:microcystin-dependent protein